MVAELPVLNNRSALEGPKSFSPSSCNPSGQCGNGLEKIYPTCAVRYGYMNYIGEFRYAPGMLFGCGGKVVIQTSRGTELGEQVSLTCTGCEKSINRDQIMKYVKRSGPEFLRLKSGKILRGATQQDLSEQTHLNQDAARKLLFARDLGKKANLPMKFVTCEQILGGERIIFFFMSEDRIDFREIVRQLAHEFHTRIEMQQVGARDEARLVADYEICGRECCCKNFLKTLRPVRMRMAKLQKATLDPSKVSGRCGRLRCCLRYEHEGYEELNAKLPNVDARVRTQRGVATVKDRQILTQLLTLVYDQTEVIETVGLEEVLERNMPPGVAPAAKNPDAPPSGRDGGPRRDEGPRRDNGPRRDGAPKRDSDRRDQRPRDVVARSAPPPAPKEQMGDEKGFNDVVEEGVMEDDVLDVSPSQEENRDQPQQPRGSDDRNQGPSGDDQQRTGRSRRRRRRRRGGAGGGPNMSGGGNPPPSGPQ